MGIYKVYSCILENGNISPEEDFKNYSDAVRFCKENANDEVQYIVYDSDGIILYDSIGKNLGNYGVMGT